MSDPKPPHLGLAFSKAWTWICQGKSQWFLGGIPALGGAEKGPESMQIGRLSSTLNDIEIFMSRFRMT